MTDDRPLDWRWRALFTPPEGVEPEWRALLAAAQRAEEQALLGYWAAKRSARPTGG